MDNNHQKNSTWKIIPCVVFLVVLFASNMNRINFLLLLKIKLHPLESMHYFHCDSEKSEEYYVIFLWCICLKMFGKQQNYVEKDKIPCYNEHEITNVNGGTRYVNGTRIRKTP